MSRNRTTLAAAALAAALAAPIGVAAPAFAEPATSFQEVSMMTSTEPRVTNPDGSLYTTPYTCQVPSGWKTRTRGLRVPRARRRSG